MDKILLTMGMPVYNEEKHIAEAIDSLLAQTYSDFVLIISDNASTDKTQQICEYYVKKDKRVIYVRQKENKGSLANFKDVLDQSKTPFFMWCGGHDKWHPSFVEKLIPLVGQDNVIISFCKTGEIKLDGTTAEILRGNYDTTVINGADNPAKRYLYFLRHFNYMGALFQGIWLTDVLKTFNFNIKSYASDVIIMEQASLKGKFKQVNEVLFWMRTIRQQETYSQMAKRELVDSAIGKVTNKTNSNKLKIIYLLESLKVVFSKRNSLLTSTKIWLTVNMIYFKSISIFVRPAAAMALKLFLSEKSYLKFRALLGRIGV